MTDSRFFPKKIGKTFLLFFLFLCSLTFNGSNFKNYLPIKSSYAAASQDALKETMCNAISLFRGPVAQAFLVLVIITTVTALFFGKLTWLTVTLIVVGCAVLFSADDIVNLLTKGASGITADFKC